MEVDRLVSVEVSHPAPVVTINPVSIEVCRSVTIVTIVPILVEVVRLVLVIAVGVISVESNTASQSNHGVDSRNISIDATDLNQTTMLTTTIVEPCLVDQTRVCNYLKLLCSLSKANKLCDEDDGVSSSCCVCSICLMDFKESDLLRVLPQCGHFFHVNDISLFSWIVGRILSDAQIS
ncbi:RING-H2 finger protein ATL46-like [Prosopis cineraria]|uniref:RING-H2 finger protein ATL46-like n=1 Tax=Prosopis cineraria TaxID=364024 RepID=UPI00240FA45A|nr:RING-H2 finger protein ATL46-like [Prosopis cineraria]